jgi:hypothetical protein
LTVDVHEPPFVATLQEELCTLLNVFILRLG